MISVNSKELLDILAFTPAHHNMMLVGRHGIGKSEILKSFYESKGMQVTTLFLGQMSDTGDIIGLPNREGGHTTFLPPYWFPLDGRPIVLFLDELNRARPEILQTIMDLTLNRTLAGRRLPEGSRIVSAVNEGEDYQLTEMDPALVSRFNIYHFTPTVEEWLMWASSSDVDKRVIKFIEQNPAVLDGSDIHDDALDTSSINKTPDRRAWNRVSDIMKLCPSGQSSGLAKAVAGVVGVEAASRFMAFILQDNIPSGEDVLCDYPNVSAKLAAADIHDLTRVNESVLRYIETDGTRGDIQNVHRYLFDIEKAGKTEAIAHFASLFSQNTYSNAVGRVVAEVPQVYQRLMAYIGNL